ncbi:MAG: 23S rRNA (adenine(2503)-C(2))-methyltransferase RlmN [Acidobacteriales bacterium]|nr:23S rRNA (adenine(2503)-C(2))-methyltransferase RlmN [Terriglobales bacterium]
MANIPQRELLGLYLQQLTEIASSFGQPAYRGRQLFHALYRQRITDFAQASTLPGALRDQLLTAGYSVGFPSPEQAKIYQSTDGTERFLCHFADGESVETVWMPEGDLGESGDGSEAGEEELRDFRRATICVSSQVGCAVNCQFCMTAQLGIIRNLTPGEIVGQVHLVLNRHQVDVERERINLVFMGQGEPFLNYDNFMQAVRLLYEGTGIPLSRMTVSTSGIVPRIYDFAKEPLRPKLAISLNAPNDDIRERIMPLTRKWNIAAILEAARQFPLKKRERLTFEYVLLDELNDLEDNARELARLIRGIRAKVNLIALNPGPDIPFGTPSDQRVRRFQQILEAAGIPAFVRRPRGRDIYAACGQLKKSELVAISP